MDSYQTWQQHKLLAWNHGHFFAAILSVALNSLQPHLIFLSKYTQNLVDVPLPCVFLWKLSAGDIFREDWSSSWEPPFLHSIDAAWLEHDTDTAKKSRASNHRRLDWSIAWVVGNCMPFVAIRKVWQNVGMWKSWCSKNSDSLAEFVSSLWKMCIYIYIHMCIYMCIYTYTQFSWKGTPVLGLKKLTLHVLCL